VAVAVVVGHPEVAEHLAVAVVRHQVPEGPPAVADPVEGDPLVKGRSRPVGVPKARSQLAASIVQMKMTRRGDAIPIASDPPLEFRLQRDLSISACSLVYEQATPIRAQADDPAAVLRQRLEALASELAELESLRGRVDRAERRQRHLRNRADLGKRASSEGKQTVVATWQI